MPALRHRARAYTSDVDDRFLVGSRAARSDTAGHVEQLSRSIYFPRNFIRRGRAGGARPPDGSQILKQ